jgi:histidinol phosphatase-like PHP family hydrolase
VDYFPGKEDEIESFLSGFDLDYMIGSVHYPGEKSVDPGPELYEEKNIDELYESYFEHSVAQFFYEAFLTAIMTEGYNLFLSNFEFK